MESRLINMFFYGLFMDAEALRAQGFHPIDARQACVPGMALQIGRRATLIPNPSKCAYGFVIGLSHQELDRALFGAKRCGLPAGGGDRTACGSIVHSGALLQSSTVGPDGGG